MTLILSEADIDQVLCMPDCLRVVDEAFADLGRGNAVSRPRAHTYTWQEPQTFYQFKTMDGGLPRYGVHAIRITSQVVQLQNVMGFTREDTLPKAAGGRYVGLVMLFDMETTEPLAIMQDSGIQRMRVGATSGIAARYLARPESSRIGLFGTGWQARPQLEALAHVLKLERVDVYSPNELHRTRFVAEMSELFEFRVVAASDPQAVICDADIVVCATNSRDPIYDGAWLTPGQHVNSLQAGELDEATYEKASLIAVRAFEKSLHFMQKDAPEVPLQAGLSKRFDKRFEPKLVELGAIIVGEHPGRTSAEEITLFGGSGTGPSSGLGIQFAAVGKLAYDLARSRGLGHKIPTDWLTQIHHP
jgi:alanine dehydrogenase